jgi:hypothetical protein
MVVHAYNPSLERQRQENYKFEISLSYTVRLFQKKNLYYSISMTMSTICYCSKAWPFLTRISLPTCLATNFSVI